MKDNLVLLDISFEDLKGSELLHKNNYFPHSIFYFQQSVEKATKFIGLDTGVINQNELQKDIGHKTLKIFNRALNKFSELNYEDELYNIQNVIKSTEISNLIPSIISLINSFNEEPIKLPFEYQNISELDHLIDILKKINPQNTDINLIKGFSDEVIEIFMSRTKRFLDTLSDYIISVQILFILNLLINDYVSLVRYPDKEMTNPNLKFDSNNSLVKSLPFLHQTLNNCIKAISNTYLARNN